METGEYFSEFLVPAHRQQLAISEVIHREKSSTQDIIVFRNPLFGTVLALDKVVQTTTGDEFIYHEMLTHVPVLAHGNVRRLLIIGGGDGGMLRHALMHKNIEQVVMVEIEPRVIDLAKEFLPEICGQAFEDPRTKLIIGDGCKYVAETPERFDVIIVDSTDPHGPGEVLFTSAFYADCKRCLTPGGLIVTQSGVPFATPTTVQNLSLPNLSQSFKDVTFYMATIPTYISGPMAFGFASDNKDLKTVEVATLEKRMKAADLNCRYYTPAIHQAAFALPRYVEKLLANQKP